MLNDLSSEREPRTTPPSPDGRVLVIAGTRPEVIKLAPVIADLRSRPGFDVRLVDTGQHRDLVPGFLAAFGLAAHVSLGAMCEGQGLGALVSRLLAALEPVFVRMRPDLVVVQGDTATAFAGALGAHLAGIRVAHVEAGLRTHDARNPFPEESHRALIARVASLHLAPTDLNRANLEAEGVPGDAIVVTGNPIVRAVTDARDTVGPTDPVPDLLNRHRGRRLIVLTTHRRESFDGTLAEHLRALVEFVAAHEDVALVAPVHPNPAVRAAFDAHVPRHPRISLMPPLGYHAFVALLSAAWLIVSDSGGIQEEAATLGKPLLVLRRRTERPEAIEAGVARLVTGGREGLATALAEALAPGAWIEGVATCPNPFGDVDSPARIGAAISAYLTRHA